MQEKKVGGRIVPEEIVGDGRRLYGGEGGGLCRMVTGVVRKYGRLRKISWAAGKVGCGLVQLARARERGGDRRWYRNQVRTERTMEMARKVGSE